MTLIVVVTTAVTAFATSPHVVCVCPNGSRTPFCLSSVLGEPGCWSATEASPSESCCKCKKAKQAHAPKFAAGSSAPLPGWNSTSCGREIAPAATFVGNHDELLTHASFDVAISFVALDAATLSANSPISNRVSPIPIDSPPDDLVSRHQRNQN